jgi:hypothetical protein
MKIPQEEPKQEATLEEVAERWFKKDEFYPDPKQGFEAGAKWQAERMYSEEDMQEYAEFCIRCYQKELPCIIAKDWFKQFKK